MPLLHIEINIKEYTLLNWYIRRYNITGQNNNLLSIHQLVSSRLKRLIEDELEPIYEKSIKNEQPKK